MLTHVSLSLDNRTLQLDALMVIGSGLYYCVAENGLGKSVNASTELRVKSAGNGMIDTHPRTRKASVYHSFKHCYL